MFHSYSSLLYLKFFFIFFWGLKKKIFIAIRTATKAGRENRKKKKFHQKNYFFMRGMNFYIQKRLRWWWCDLQKKWKKRKKEQRKENESQSEINSRNFLLLFIAQIFLFFKSRHKWKYRKGGWRQRESHADRIIIIIMWRVENLCFMLTQSTIYQVFMSSGGCLWMDSYLLYFFLVSMQSMSDFNLLSLVKSLS